MDFEGKVKLLSKGKDVIELKKTILENEIELIDLKCTSNKYIDRSDILIHIIENNFSPDIVEFIIITGKYDILNYKIKNKTPLSSALKNCNYKIANLLLKYGANINYIPNNILIEILNSSNLKYLLNRKLNISSDFICSLIKEKKNHLLKLIYKYYIYDNDFIINILSFCKGNVKNAYKNINEMIECEKSKLNFDKNLYEFAFYCHNFEAFPIIYNYDIRDIRHKYHEISNIFFDENKFWSEITYEINSKEEHKEFINYLNSPNLHFKHDKILINCSNFQENTIKLLKIKNLNEIKNFVDKTDLLNILNSIKNSYNLECLIYLIKNNISVEFFNYILDNYQYQNLNNFYQIWNERNVFIIAVALNNFILSDFMLKKFRNKLYDINLGWFYENREENCLNNNGLKYLLNKDINLFPFYNNIHDNDNDNEYKNKNMYNQENEIENDNINGNENENKENKNNNKFYFYRRFLNFLMYKSKDDNDKDKSLNIKTLIYNHEFKFLNTIFKYYIYSNSFIIKLLLIHKTKTSLSCQELKKMIEKEKNKIHFNRSLYNAAVDVNDNNILNIIYENDYRNDNIIQNDVINILKNMENSKKLELINCLKKGKIKNSNGTEFINYLDNADKIEKTVFEKINTNNKMMLYNFINEKNISLLNLKVDPLIYSIENDISFDIINYIIHHYKSLNYMVNGKSPLICSIKKNNFRIANLLLKNGADINYISLFNNLDNKTLRNDVFKFIFNNGYKLSSELIKELIVCNSFYANKFLKIILKYYIFDNSIVLYFLSIYKHQIQISDTNINNIIISEKNKFLIEWLKLAYDDYNYEALDILLDFYKENTNEINNNREIAMNINHTYSQKQNIDFNINNDNICKEKFIIFRIIWITISNNNYELMDKILNSGILKYHRKFDLKDFFYYLSDKKDKLLIDEELALEIDRTKNRKVFELKKVTNYNFLYYFIDKLLLNGCIDFEWKENFEKILFFLVRIYNTDLIKSFIQKSFKSKELNFKNVNFNIVLLILNLSDNQYSDALCELDITSSLQKLFIKLYFQHKNFDLNDIDIKETLLLMIRLECNIFVIKYFIRVLLQCKEFDIQKVSLSEILLPLSKLQDNELLKYTIDNLLNHHSFSINNHISVNNILYNISLLNNDKIKEYVIKILFDYHSLKFNGTVIENILLALNKINDNSFMESILEIIFNPQKSHPKIINNNKSINTERILLSSIFHNNAFIMKYIFEKLLNTVDNRKCINFETLLLSSNKMNNIYAMQLIMEKLLNVNSLDKVFGKHRKKGVNLYIIKYQINTQFLTLIINTLVKLENLKLIRYFLNCKELSSHLDINMKDKNNEYPIITALHYSYNSEIFEYLLNHGANCHVNDVNGDSLLWIALKNRYYKALSILLNRNISVPAEIIIHNLDLQKTQMKLDDKFKSKNSLLIQAIYENKINTVKSLINNDNYTSSLPPKKKRRKNKSDKDNTFNDKMDIDIVNDDDDDDNNNNNNNNIENNDNYYNNDYYNDITYKNYDKDENYDLYQYFTPLTLSYLLKYIDIFNILLDFCDINERDYNGYNILHFAILKNDIELIQKLISRGININFKTNLYLNIHSSLDISIIIKNKEIFNYLLKNGNKKLDQIKEKGESPSLTIIKMKSFTDEEKIEWLKCLIANGWDFKAYNNNSIPNNNKYNKSYDYEDQNNKNLILKTAINEDSVSLFKFIIKNKCLIDCTSYEDFLKFIMKYIAICGGYNIIKYLAETHIDWFSIDVLKEFIKQGRFDFISLLIPNYIDINSCSIKNDNNNNNNGSNNNILFYAIESNNEEITKYYRNNILIYAIEYENKEITQYLINNKIHVNKEFLNYNYLEKIMSMGLEIVKLFIPNFIKINVSDCNKKTPLAYAIKNGNEKIIKYLIECNADVNKKIMHSNIKPLNLAILLNNINVVKTLIANGADIYKAIKKKKSNSHTRCLGANCRICKNRNKNNNNINNNNNITNINNNININNMTFFDDENVEYDHANESSNINTPLIEAIKKNNEDIVKILIDKGADVNKKGKDININFYNESDSLNNNTTGSSPMAYAIQFSNEKIIKMLIKAGADVNETIGTKYTPLILAILNHRENIVKSLIENKANIENKSKNSNGISPLTIAILENNKSILNYLIEGGAKININKEIQKYHPLFIAIKYAKENAVQCLIQNGVNINIKTNNGIAPLFWALLLYGNSIPPNENLLYNNISNKPKLPRDYQGDMLNIIKYLIDQDIHKIYNKECINILLQSFRLNKNLLKYLIKKGIDVNQKDKNGNTLLIDAIHVGDTHIVKYLICHGAKTDYKNDKGQYPLDIVEFYINEYEDQIQKGNKHNYIPRILNKYINIKDILNYYK